MAGRTEQAWEVSVASVKSYIEHMLKIYIFEGKYTLSLQDHTHYLCFQYMFLHMLSCHAICTKTKKSYNRMMRMIADLKG